MAKRIQLRRLIWLGFLLGAAFVGLGYRLVDLQVLRHDRLRAQSQKQQQFLVSRESRRGDIRDIRGNLLATSQMVKTLCADPSLIGPYAAPVARLLAAVLQTNDSFLHERLQPRLLRYNEKREPIYDRYVVLKRKVPVEQWEQVQQTMSRAVLVPQENALLRRERDFLRILRQQAIFCDPQEDQLRIYPLESLGAHVLGHVGVDERAGAAGEIAGKDGVELVLNSKLRGVRGWRQIERDQRGRELVAFREQDVEPRSGLNMVLTLDAGLQHIVEEELVLAMEKHQPISASALMVRPQTGEILAMATMPTFNPNHPGAAEAAERRNRIISDLAEPGSTFKIVVVSAALNEGLVSLTDTFDCENGRFIFAGKPLRDHEPYGVLSVEEIITKSSNIGSAKIGIKLGAERLYHYLRAFGFGERTGISLPGEVSGIVHPVSAWSKLSISRIPMGHEVAVTPLQMVMAMSAIANGGRLMRPMIIDRLENEAGQIVVKYQPQSVRQVISPTAARQMTIALKTVVNTNGTGTKAMLEHYTVAGKTGTAQKPGPGGYLPGKYFSSFIGFFPADRPVLCLSVVLDEPKHAYYGGQTAAPIYKNIAERSANYLSIRPDGMAAAPANPPAGGSQLTGVARP